MLIFAVQQLGMHWVLTDQLQNKTMLNLLVSWSSFVIFCFISYTANTVTGTAYQCEGFFLAILQWHDPDDGDSQLNSTKLMKKYS